MLKNSRLPLIFSMRAKILVMGPSQMENLGAHFATAVAGNDNERSIKIGLLAQPGTGKTTLLKGFQEALGYSFQHEDGYEIYRKGMRSALNEQGELLRHFDLAANTNTARWKLGADFVDPFDALCSPRPAPGIDIVEHANILANDDYDYIVRLHRHGRNTRTVDFYCSSERAAQPEFQQFVTDYAPIRARPHHYILDAFDRMYYPPATL